MTSVGATFVAILLIVNGVLYFLVVRPLRRMARVADELSLGEMSAADFPDNGGGEIADLARSFNRLRKSLDKALKLLES
jgi:protein-histidine pros-kinase